MSRRIVFLFALCSLMLTMAIAQAATITVCTLDDTVYHQGDTGRFTLNIYNDKTEKIRVTELTAEIEYFYSDGTLYIQTFFTNATLPLEIEPGQTGILYIPFSLPNNIASGYTKPQVRARTEMWSDPLFRFMPSDYESYESTLYIESPYKQQTENQQNINQQLQHQLDEMQQQLRELQALNDNTTLTMYLFAVMTMALVPVAIFLVIMYRRDRAVAPPVN